MLIELDILGPLPSLKKSLSHVVFPLLRSADDTKALKSTSSVFVSYLMVPLLPLLGAPLSVALRGYVSIRNMLTLLQKVAAPLLPLWGCSLAGLDCAFSRQFSAVCLKIVLCGVTVPANHCFWTNNVTH